MNGIVALLLLSHERGFQELRENRHHNKAKQAPLVPQSAYVETLSRLFGSKTAFSPTREPRGQPEESQSDRNGMNHTIEGSYGVIFHDCTDPRLAATDSSDIKCILDCGRYVVFDEYRMRLGVTAFGAFFVQ